MFLEAGIFRVVPTGWHGQLQLIYGCVGEQTQIQHRLTRSPLRLQRPFYPNTPSICESVMLHTAGGIVGGDRLSLTIELQPRAQALVTTAAAQKIYRSNGRIAQQMARMQVAAGACLEWLPQETIVFAQAQYRQSVHVELAPGASWLGWEITRFGRTARGEVFEAGDWRSQTQIWQHNRPLWIDQQWLPGSATVVNSPHGLARQPVVGSLAWVGVPVDHNSVEKARELWQGPASAIGVTRLQSGLLCRYRGSDRQAVRHWFIQVWQLIRDLQGRSAAVPPRVWQL